MKQKSNALYQGEPKNYTSDEKCKIRDDILHYIMEKGLTINQAYTLLKDIIDIMTNYAVLISIADYEKITGRDITNPDLEN